MKIRVAFLTVVLIGASAKMTKADACNGVANNLVSNCGFESGTFAGYMGTATSLPSALVGVDDGDPFTSFQTPYQGRYEAYLGSLRESSLVQALRTQPGEDYLIEFALLNDTSPFPGYPNKFLTSFGSQVLFSKSDLQAGAYNLYTFEAVATSADTPLTFTSENQTGYFELDSISVSPLATVATPEPGSLLLVSSGVLSVTTWFRRRSPERKKSFAAHMRTRRSPNVRSWCCASAGPRSDRFSRPWP